ncbi:MAG: radical SAM protein [Spirochaetales bacterium]|nr:radical SAM protein [Spirochaetales bacterium]
MSESVSISVSSETNLEFRKPLEKSIRSLFTSALKAAFTRLRFFLFLLPFIGRQKKAARLRKSMAIQGVNVPPFMIMSVTSACNLRCKGCYSRIHHRNTGPEMDDSQLTSILAQADRLGVSIALLAGGEPLKRDRLLDITAGFPDMLFPLFTNGLLIDEAVCDQLRKQPNIVPVLSIEGTEQHTDARRGKNTQASVFRAMELLNKRGIFFGVSFTVCRDNLATITDRIYLAGLYRRGVRVFFYNEYVPFEEGTEEKCLVREERELLEQKLAMLRRSLLALFISFPGDESQFEGCLSAGRGFFHVNPAGRLEPCPFAPYSKDSLIDVPLAEALQSRFLRTVRDNHRNLYEDQGGCALWNNRKWLEEVHSNS